MKKTALLAAAAAMMMATPAAAQGYLGLEYSNGNIDFGGPDLETDGWQGEGAFGFGGTGSWGAQLDASFGNLSTDTDDVDAYTLGGHLWWQGSGWRLGGVVTTTNLDDGGTELDEIGYGIEGTWDLGPSANLYSSYTIGEVDAGGPDGDLSNWDFGANFYASPNIRFGGFFGVGNIDSGGGDVDTTSFGINGEFQPWSAPVSITVGWNNFEIEDADVSSDVFQIGARWNFGGGTLQERNNATPFDTNSGYVNRLYGIW
ncbi:hypothetical protein [Terricaulis sp.]|uniref:hypothetical protein n=1 Tax=Terricaulis sp. TaxID=2768686 RepID=UPI002AC677BB|nr:hypothetical protein [Terricaulis sp.]MDZ4692122.1 hypothetical protein [Terricaulis sp.]